MRPVRTAAPGSRSRAATRTKSATAIRIVRRGPVAAQGRDEVLPVGHPWRPPAGERGRDPRGVALAALRVRPVGLRGELRQHVAPHELERLADVLVAVAASLDHEDELIDAGAVVAP